LKYKMIDSDEKRKRKGDGLERKCNPHGRGARGTTGGRNNFTGGVMNDRGKRGD